MTQISLDVALAGVCWFLTDMAIVMEVIRSRWVNDSLRDSFHSYG